MGHRGMVRWSLLRFKLLYRLKFLTLSLVVRGVASNGCGRVAGSSGICRPKRTQDVCHFRSRFFGFMVLTHHGIHPGSKILSSLGQWHIGVGCLNGLLARFRSIKRVNSRLSFRKTG